MQRYNHLTVSFNSRLIPSSGLSIQHPSYEDANNAHERALVFMHKMPRIWIDYGEWLMRQEYVTRTRRTFDRALRALPVTQHNRIWMVYIKFLKRHDITETAVRCFRRFVKLSPECIEEFIDYLLKNDRLDEAARYLSGSGMNKFQKTKLLIANFIFQIHHSVFSHGYVHGCTILFFTI